MGKVIALANQKGGVAKTTSTINLAYALKQRGQAVLVIDMDPQASLTIYCGRDPRKLESQRKTIYWGLTRDDNNRKDISSLIISGSIPLLPASLQLSKVEFEFFLQPWDSSSIVRDELKPLRDQYDILLVDCPPTLSLITINALVAADSVIIPVETDFLSIMGIPLLFETITNIRSKPNPNLTIAGILPTKYNQNHKEDREALDELRNLAKPHIHVFNPIIRTTEYKKSASRGLPTLEFNPQAPGVQDYYKVADYIITYGC